MRVRVDEPRHDELAAHVDHVAFQRYFRLVSDTKDRVAADHHASVRKETVFSIYGQDGAVGERYKHLIAA